MSSRETDLAGSAPAASGELPDAASNPALDGPNESTGLDRAAVPEAAGTPLPSAEAAHRALLPAEDPELAQDHLPALAQTQSVLIERPGLPPARVNLSVEVPQGVRVQFTIENIGTDSPIITPVAPPALAPSAPQAGSTPAPASPPGGPTAPAARPSGPAGWPLAQRAARAWQMGAVSAARAWAWLRSQALPDRLAMTLFAGALLTYTLTRFIGLQQFPIYFFSDEAIQTLNAADFIHNGFRDYLGRYFPTYFQNATYFNLSVSVYAQMLPYLLLGKSILVTRGTSVVISVFGAVAVGLLLKHGFKQPWWWLGSLLLSITPAWFLHSRTAFETVLMVVFYAWFAYFYLRYRTDAPRLLLAALLCAALAFYSYNGGQAVVVATGLLLLVVDLPYHWRHRRLGLVGLAFLVLLILPYVRFMREQPGEAITHLRTLDSYLVSRSLSLPQKLAQFWNEYRYGLSLTYWFLPDNGHDLPRHVMRGYGHLLPLTLPFVLTGLLVALRHLRQPAYRLVLVMLLAGPVSGALTSVGITRVLVLVIPGVLLTALGVEQLRRLAPRWTPAPVAVGVFVLLAMFNVHMLRDALANGPTWYHDYGLGGMQYGARQLFAEIKSFLAERPDRQVLVSSTWTNGADYVLRFFLDDESRVRMESLEGYTSRGEPLSDRLTFVVVQDEYARALQDPKLANIRIERMIPYPDGTPGFYFLTVGYSDAAQSILAAERQASQLPVTETFVWQGEAVLITHSRFDAGRLDDVLDADAFTLANAPGANPFVLDFSFPSDHLASELVLTTGSMDDFTVTLSLYPAADAEPTVFTERYQGLAPDPTVTLSLAPGTLAFRRARLEIQNNLVDDDSVNIHVRDIFFR